LQIRLLLQGLAALSRLAPLSSSIPVPAQNTARSPCHSSTSYEAATLDRSQDFPYAIACSFYDATPAGIPHPHTSAAFDPLADLVETSAGKYNMAASSPLDDSWLLLAEKPYPSVINQQENVWIIPTASQVGPFC
jgi:hypothetical protein